MKKDIILASASPRRSELLDQIQISYMAFPVEIDETPRLNELPLSYVERIAAEKSELCRELVNEDLPVLGADTSVVVDGRIFGKPQNFDEFYSMFEMLSGRTHQVLSSISLRGKQHWQKTSVTRVSFRPVTKQEMQMYWCTGEPKDKAGGYAIQGLGGVFVTKIEGSYSGVVGLPIFETVELLTKQGIKILT